MRTELRNAQCALYALILLPTLLLAQVGEPGNCSQSDWDDYFELVQNHVRDKWRPPYTQRAVNCTILVRQDFRREVEHVELLACDDDATVRKSAEDAGYAASPLPPPAVKACFSRQIPVRLIYQP